MTMLESLWQDVRYALRMMRRSPGFTIVAVLSLALGIGANTAIFSLINALMLRTLPVRDPRQLVELVSRHPGEPDSHGFAWRFYERFRDQNHVFSDLIGMSPSRFQVAREGLAEESIDGAYVVGNFFPALGLQPAIGRLIGPQDEHAESAVAVVSWSYWKTRFNLDPAVVGRRIVVDRAPAVIVGVTPREFFGLEVGAAPDLWLRAATTEAIQRADRPPNGPWSGSWGLMGRLKPGVSIDQARAELSVLDRARVEEIATASRNPLWRQAKLGVEPAGAGFSTLRGRFASLLLALMGLVALLLLLACTNVASLLLARGAARHRELAVRVSLGAGRLRLVRQALTESLLLSGIATLLGILLAYFGTAALVRMITSGRQVIGLPRTLALHVEPDLRVLLFAATVAVVTGVLFGIAPVLNALASAPVSSLREIGGAGEPRSRRLFGRSLVVAQVALSMALLSTASLFVSHLSALRNIGLGFERESVLLVTLDPARSGYQRTQLASLYQELLGRLQALPGVRSATLSGVTPIEGPGASRFATVEGFTEKPEDRRYLSLNWVAPKYFETLGTPLLAGRDFEFDDAARPPVAIVNQSMARHYFGAGSALGKHLGFDRIARVYEIVGVVGDAKYMSLQAAPPRMVYMNAFQEGRGTFAQFALRTSIAPASVAGGVRRLVGNTLNGVSIARVTTLDDQLNASIVPERLIAFLSTFFAAVGALLAAIGLYGLLAYTVARRTSEIGIRMALGATRRDVIGMVVRSALGLVCAGVAVGAPVAYWSKRLAASVMQNLPADGALPIAFAAAAMLGMALFATWLPALRAARVDPMDALRHD